MKLLTVKEWMFGCLVAVFLNIYFGIFFSPLNIIVEDYSSTLEGYILYVIALALTIPVSIMEFSGVFGSNHIISLDTPIGYLKFLILLILPIFTLGYILSLVGLKLKPWWDNLR